MTGTSPVQLRPLSKSRTTIAKRSTCKAPRHSISLPHLHLILPLNARKDLHSPPSPILPPPKRTQSEKKPLSVPSLAATSSSMTLYMLSIAVKLNPCDSHEAIIKRNHAIFLFTYRVLETLKLSEDVVYLSVLYIYRLVIRSMSVQPLYFPSHLPSTLNSSDSVHNSAINLTPRQLIIVSLMLATKFLEDKQFKSKTWAAIGGLEIQDLNRVERECLSAMQYNLSVNETEWADWKKWVNTVMCTFASNDQQVPHLA